MWEVNIYTHTNITTIRASDGGYGYVLEVLVNGQLRTKEGVELITDTPNGAQISALLEAVKQLKTTDCSIKLYTASAYLVGGLAQLEARAANGWKTSKGKEIAYSEKWSEMKEILHGTKIETVLVADHAYTSWIDTEIKKLKENSDGKNEQGTKNIS